MWSNGNCCFTQWSIFLSILHREFAQNQSSHIPIGHVVPFHSGSGSVFLSLWLRKFEQNQNRLHSEQKWPLGSLQLDCLLWHRQQQPKRRQRYDKEEAQRCAHTSSRHQSTWGHHHHKEEHHWSKMEMVTNVCMSDGQFIVEISFLGINDNWRVTFEGCRNQQSGGGDAVLRDDNRRVTLRTAQSHFQRTAWLRTWLPWCTASSQAYQQCVTLGCNSKKSSSQVAPSGSWPPRQVFGSSLGSGQLGAWTVLHSNWSGVLAYSFMKTVLIVSWWQFCGEVVKKQTHESDPWAKNRAILTASACGGILMISGVMSFSVFRLVQ